MKHSSGRARSAATLAATAFGDVVGGVLSSVTFEAARTIAWRVTVAAALAVVPVASVYAQKAAAMPQGMILPAGQTGTIRHRTFSDFPNY